jgi:hypothetical protein
MVSKEKYADRRVGISVLDEDHVVMTLTSLSDKSGGTCAVA